MSAKTSSVKHAYTSDDVELLAKIRDDILARRDFYEEGMKHLQSEYSQERLHAEDAKIWKEWSAKPKAPPLLRPERDIWHPTARFQRAIADMLDANGSTQNDLRAKATLLLAIMLWDERAEQRDSIFSIFGPWEGDQPFTGRRWGIIRKQRSVQDPETYHFSKRLTIRLWMDVVRAAWHGLPKGNGSTQAANGQPTVRLSNPAFDPRPRINLLPLTDPQRETFAAAVRLVLADPSGYADTVRWLESEYSVEAYRKRHEQQWEAGRQAKENQARCAPSVEELAALGGVNGYTPPTSWHSKNDANGNTILDKYGNTKYFFDKKRDDQRRAEAKAFAKVNGMWRYRYAMKVRREMLAKIAEERRRRRAVSQVQRLRLAMRDLAEAEMEIGADTEVHARKLVFVAYLLVWHETRDDLGEFGRWKWDGLAISLVAESVEEADRLENLPPGRDRVLFQWFGFDKRKVDDEVAGLLNGFVSNLAQAVPLLPPLPMGPGVTPKKSNTSGKARRRKVDRVKTVAEETPLTVTEAAKLVSPDTWESTKPLISRACGHGDIKSNGKTGPERRINLESLKGWWARRARGQIDPTPEEIARQTAQIRETKPA